MLGQLLFNIEHAKDPEIMNVAPKKDAKYVVGVDLGGTNVRAAIVSKDETILGQDRGSSDAKLGAAKVISRLTETIRDAAKDAKVSLDDIGAVGIAVPGHIESRKGIIIWSPNFGETVDGAFKMFLDVPFTGPLSEELGIASYAGNDANVAALGEFRYGAGRHVTDMVMFTLGTGIGSGVVSDGRLVTGSTGGAVEMGHQTIVAGGWRCGCHNLGCLEAYCGTAGILERAQRLIEENPETSLRPLVEENRTCLTPRLIDEHARAGDAVAKQVFEEIGYYLGIGMANAVMIFNPSVIALGGGIRKAGGLLAAAERSMRNHAVHSLAHTCKVVEAQLGEDAGVMGAAELAWRHVEH
jgi:glucokinase